MTVLAEVKSAFDLTRARFLSAILLKEQGRAEAAAAWREAGQAILAAGYAFLLEQERELAYPLVAAYLNHPEVAVLAISQWLVEQFQRVPPPLRIVTLGRFEARQGQRRVEQRPLRQRRAGESLALLSLAPGRSLSTEEIIEALWPEREPPAAQTAIHHATSALRHALEPELPDKFPSRYLAAEEGRITLCLPPSSEVDVETMESHYRQGEWEIVLRIYGGDFFLNTHMRIGVLPRASGFPFFTDKRCWPPPRRDSTQGASRKSWRHVGGFWPRSPGRRRLYY